MTAKSDYKALIQHLEIYRQSDPLLFLRGIALTQDVTSAELRFLRAEVLHALAAKLHSGMRMCDFRNEIVLRPEGLFVNVGGVLMESSRAGYYLKESGVPQQHTGEHLIDVLRKLEIDVTTAVDVGANVGEVSLWLAREYPEARILAIEPSSDNISVLELNMTAQSFSTDGIEILQVAVSDKPGDAAMRRGVGSMNRVIDAVGADDTESVKCERLDDLLDRHGVRTADFIKIDIEGGEPKLREALVNLRDRVRCYYIEFSQFASFDDYIALASGLLSQGYTCRDDSGSSILSTVDDVSDHLAEAFSQGPVAVTNLWFTA